MRLRDGRAGLGHRAGLAHDLRAADLAEQAPGAGAGERLVVDDQDAERGGHGREDHALEAPAVYQASETPATISRRPKYDSSLCRTE